MAKKSKIKLLHTTIIALILFSGCASQLPPGGGEVDTVPPKIIEVIPDNGTINYKQDFFEITFSKYVDKRSVQEAIFISPTVQKGFVYDWSGRTLRVYFKDTLKLNTTYTVTLGTDIFDLNNHNKMAEPFTFAFSTGSKIDKGKIAGRIYDEKPDGVMVFAYQSNGKEIDPSKQKPDFVSQVGKNGKYTLLGLGDGNILLFAIRDKLRDLKYQKNEDAFGTQYKKIELGNGTIEVNNVDFFLTMEDTIPPKLTNVTMRDRNHLTVEFSENIDSAKISSSNFTILDTTTQKKVLPKYFYKGDSKPNQYFLALKDTIDKKDGWMLVIKDVTDMSGNISKNDKTAIKVKNDRDTLSVKLAKVSGELPDGKVDYDNPKILMTFNDAVELEILKEKTTLQDAKGNKIEINVDRVDDALFRVNPIIKLKQNTEYTLKLDLKKYNDFCGNKVDSIFINKFTTSSELDFSGASGTVTGVSDSLNTIVVLQNTVQSKVVYKQKVGAKRNFDFKKVVPGKYLLWNFKDRNNNDKYDNGSIKPFSYAEEFRFYQDTLNLRTRWPVGDININDHD